MDFTSIDTLSGDQCITYDELRNFKVGQECSDDHLTDCRPCNNDSYSQLCSTLCDMITTCKGHGRCIGSSGSCRCHDGWSGESCNVYTLEECPGGFSGTDCKPCEENVYSNCSKLCDMMQTCHGHGRCIGSSGMCKCHNGWSGESCNVTVSTPTQCPDGYSGTDCEPCEENLYSNKCSQSCDMITTCSSHGRCAGSSGMCKCHGVWSGDSCNVPVSTPTQCPDGYSGTDCEPCQENLYSNKCSQLCDMLTTCGGHGRCAGSSGMCKCHGVWSGASCSETDSLKQILIGFDVDGNGCLSQSEFETATTRPVRLSDCGLNSCGRIEVEQSGHWGTVCAGKICIL
jgi:hypothetical protein